MARERPQKTLADYVAIAISPALIMLLIGSLAWFLLEVTYDDRYDDRIRWVLFWFVFGSVLVGRIAIEQGSQHAAVYWVAIFLAGLAVVFRLLATYQLGALVLLGLIMWCANKLTWDCTLIDDSQDASGEGLLQVSGFEESTDQQAASANNSGNGAEGRSAPDASSVRVTERPEDPAGNDHPADVPAPVPLWKRFFVNRSERENRPHAPGLWVVYFSLAALPLFGVGQLLIPVEERASRSWGFKLLIVYVAAALGLLLTTSFLGLRRYLRQRKLTMPVRMTAAWLVTGAVMVLALLAVCLILPRPGSTTSITDAIDKVASKARDASKFAFLKDDAGENQGTPTGRPAGEQEASQQPDSGGQAGRGGKQAGQSDDNRQPAERDGQSNSEGQKSGTGQAQGQGGSGSSGEKSQHGQSDNSSGRDQNQSGQQQSQQQAGRSGQQDSQRGNQGQQDSGQNQASAEQRSGTNQPQQQSEQGQAGNRSEQRQDQGGSEQRRDQAADQREPGRQSEDGDQQQQQRDQERDSGGGGGGGSPPQEQQEQQQSTSGGSSDQSDSSQQSTMPESNTPAANTPTAANWIGRLVKIVLYLILAAVALYFIIKHWQTILTTLGRMWDELRSLFASLFGGQRAKSSRAGASADDILAPAPPRPFASFDNPFHTGAAARMSPEQLVIYTFRALEAWGYDNNRQRTADQTPLEYAAELSGQFPEVADAARTSSRLLTRVAYAEHAPSDRYPEMLEPVWKSLTRTARRPAMAM